MDVYLELDPRAALPANSMIIRGYTGRTVNVDSRENTDRCPRRGRPADAHAWRVYDLTDTVLVRAQDGVLDCGILGEER